VTPLVASAPCRRRLAVPAVLMAILALGAPPASASPPRPADLRVADGDSWHADNSFSILWTAPLTSSPPLAWTHYRVRDPQGTLTESGIATGGGDGIGALVVPKVPGIYTAEVWFEDTAGAQGPAAETSLRFDNTRPGAVEPASAPTWIGRTAFPLRVRIGHPAGPVPPAGIRGYAVSIDGSPSGSPCIRTDRCTNAETSLRGGVGEDELELGLLPEGIHYLHAVAVSGSGMKSATSGNVALRADLTDPETRLLGAPGGWTDRGVSLVALATDATSGMVGGAGSAQPFTAIRVDGGAPSIAPGASATARVLEEGVHRVEYYARDAAGNVDDGATVNGIANRAPRTAAVRIDRTPPAVAFANSQDPHEPDLLRASVDDRLAGADPSRGWIGVRPAGSGAAFHRLPGLPGRSGELRARWDSDSSPPGDYEFQTQRRGDAPLQPAQGDDVAQRRAWAAV